MAWLYVPDMEGLNLELSECFQNPEPFVMLRGKPSRFNTLSRKWKKGGWITRLSGLTSKPSTASLGVEKWICSLEDSHASPIQVLENKWGKKTQETYGPILLESLGRCDQDSYSLKMFQMSLTCDYLKLSLTSINWGIMLHGVLYRLPKLAHRIEEGVGSSLQFGTLIPTPNAADGLRTNNHHQRGNLTLKGYAETWPTPTTKGWGHAAQGQTAALIKKVEKGIITIQEAEKMLNLKDLTNHRTWKKMFPTPSKMDAQKSGNYKPENKSQAGKSLVSLAKANFPTPAARDWKGPYPRKNGGGLPDIVEEWKKNGEGDLMNGGRLNPQWVAWLMGLPIGWINLDY